MSGDLTYGVPFAARHIGPSSDEQRRMLEVVGYGSVEELMDAAIPEVIRWHGNLDLPSAASEAEVTAELRAIAGANTVAVSMIGLGYSLWRVARATEPDVTTELTAVGAK